MAWCQAGRFCLFQSTPAVYAGRNAVFLFQSTPVITDGRRYSPADQLDITRWFQSTPVITDGRRQPAGVTQADVPVVSIHAPIASHLAKRQQVSIHARHH